LPTGLTLSSAGVLSGTPTASGTYTFTVTATSVTYSTCSASLTYNVTMNCPTITVAPATLPNLVANAIYSTNTSATVSPVGLSGLTFSISSGDRKSVV
jgi:hypothetical protein